jgi:hypothetical protein
MACKGLDAAPGQAVAGAAVESDVCLSQRREYIARELVHKGLLLRGLLINYSPIDWVTLSPAGAESRRKTAIVSGASGTG